MAIGPTAASVRSPHQPRHAAARASRQQHRGEIRGRLHVDAEAAGSARGAGTMPDMDADVLVIGGGLAGLVATAELAAEGSLGDGRRRRAAAVAGRPGVLVVGRPVRGRHPRAAPAADPRLDRAGAGRTGSAARRSTATEDYWPRQWAEAYVHFAGGEQQSWLHELGVRFFPLVQWAERGGYAAPGHGNSVPRFHLVWGTGPAVVEPFAAGGAEVAPGPDAQPAPGHRSRRRRRRGDPDRRRAGVQRRARGARCRRRRWRASSVSPRRPR